MMNADDSTHRLPGREQPPMCRAPLAALKVFLVLSALCALLAIGVRAGTYWTGQSIGSVTVTLEGPGERLVVQEGDPSPATYLYTATGVYQITGEKEEEAEEKTIGEAYNWSVGNAIVVSGGGQGDSTVTVKYAPDDESDNTISVTYTATPGGSDSASVSVVVPAWEAGEPIECTGGITSPEDDSAFAVGQEVPLTIDTVTDTDKRIGADTTEPADTCTVTWSATAGTFKDDVNTGTSVTWIAPAQGENNIVITATVSDEAQVPAGEKGTRDDEDYTDSITVCAFDISVTIPAMVSVNQSGIPVQATLMAGSTPVAGKSVSFSSSDLAFDHESAVTTEQGIATVTATASATPSTALDASSVTATCLSATATGDFTIVRVNYAGASRDTVIVGGYDIDSLYSSVLTFSVTPAIVGVPLSFSFDTGEGNGDLIPAALENPSPSTDAVGVGTVRVRSGDLCETPTVRCSYHASSATKDIPFTGITSVSAGN